MNEATVSSTQPIAGLSQAAATPALDEIVSAPSGHEFDQFFRLHYPGLLTFVRKRTTSRADAEEISQESCVRLLQYGSIATRPEPVWKGLLYQIASNLVVDNYRKGLRSRPIVNSYLELPSHAPQPEMIALAAEDLAAIRQALLRLPPRTRQIFLLSRAHHKTYQEIARICGVSVKAIEKHISRALRDLRHVARNNDE